MYYVWKRSDGKIGASTGHPYGWKTPTAEITFQVLCKAATWDEACAFLTSINVKTA